MSYVGNAPISAAFLTDTFSGTGSQTAFTMTVAPANTSSIIVAVTGVLQDPSTYSVSGTTLTFSAAPPSGTSNISVRYLGIPASGVTTTAYRTVTNTTATAGQTSFTIPSYTVGYIDVYRNGVYLPTSDYTATTGTTVVLTNAATAGDTITTISFYVSSVLNAVLTSGGASTNQTLTSPIIIGSTPQVTTYTSGSGTYTVPTNCRYLQIKMVGGGGGGSGVANSGGDVGVGGSTTFGTSLLTCNGGAGGIDNNTSGGIGGTATINSPAIGIAIKGGYGNPPSYWSGDHATGGNGGSSPFFGGGGSGSGSTNYGAATAGIANTGGGGGGGMAASTSFGGSGGGSGGFIEAFINSPSATYSYSVGAGGAGGAVGSGGSSTFAGAAGGSGVIYIIAFF
jgi:hypothetical protein